MEQVMTKLDMREFKTEETTVTAQTPVTAVQAPITTPAAPPLPEPLRGDPAMIALPTVIAGAVGLFLTTIGFVPASAGLAAIPVILAATVLGLLISTVWAAMLGQNIVATLYAVFLGFYASYVALQLGIANNWYKIPTDQIGNTVAVYLICWLVAIVMLTLATLRLPVAFTILLGLVDVVLAVLLVTIYQPSAVLQIVAGLLVFAFVAEGIYLYFHVMSLAFGGKGLPLGKPLIQA